MTKIRSFLAFDIPDAMKKDLTGIIDVLIEMHNGTEWADLPADPQISSASDQPSVSTIKWK